MAMLSHLAAQPFSFLAASAFLTGHAPVAAAVASPTLHHAAVEAAAADTNNGVTSNHPCSSNSTHIGWICDDGNNGVSNNEAMDEARTRMTEYLWENVMPYDVPNARTLGFDPDAIMASYEDDSIERNNNGHPFITSRAMQLKTTVDGLSDGILNQTLFYSLQAKTLYPWTDYIPRSIYMEYVVPYAVVNEPRSDHRSLLFHALKETLKNYERPNNNHIKMTHRRQDQTSSQTQIKEAVKLINTRLWSILGRDSKPIVFQAGLTPRIYDPLSVIAYGHSSCTGLAILLIAALRSVGIAARMAGTPAWYGETTPDK